MQTLRDTICIVNVTNVLGIRCRGRRNIEYHMNMATVTRPLLHPYLSCGRSGMSTSVYTSDMQPID